MEDKLLVFRCKRGSREALARIYQKYKADLLLLAMGLLNDRSAAEDVVHDVFLSFVRGLDAFRLTGSLKGYLLTCVANHARNCNKAERVRSQVGPGAGWSAEPSEGVMPPAEDSALESLVCNEQLRLLSGALGGLPFEQREVILLHLASEMTFGAIGKARGISANTAKSRYRYGLDKLRLLLNGEATR
ncbi:MAG: RNA polymerase sigma factor [Sedimentisphaerales bacterium]|nr:RNA polymerase sigma factor [Sedimentisphaerales bacterium]